MKTSGSKPARWQCLLQLFTKNGRMRLARDANLKCTITDAEFVRGSQASSFVAVRDVFPGYKYLSLSLEHQQWRDSDPIIYLSMVLLTMTPAVVAAVKIYTRSGDYMPCDGEPSLEVPAIGSPISHGQLIDISKYLKQNPEKAKEDGSGASIHLSELLRGCTVYIPPPPVKPEKSEEYKALMARLRVEEESRKYTQMLDSAPTAETFAQRFPNPSQGYLFPPERPQAENEDDDMTYADINRQMAMIANVLISIIACSIGVWKVAWHWDTPQRLALSMVSSIVVAMAEVAIYAGYLGRLQEAKETERKKVETKEVAESWVIEAKPNGIKEAKRAGKAIAEATSGMRLRVGNKEG